MFYIFDTVPSSHDRMSYEDCGDTCNRVQFRGIILNSYYLNVIYFLLHAAETILHAYLLFSFHKCVEKQRKITTCISTPYFIYDCNVSYHSNCVQNNFLSGLNRNWLWFEFCQYASILDCIIQFFPNKLFNARTFP